MATKKKTTGKAGAKQGTRAALAKRGDAYEEDIPRAELEALLNEVGDMSAEEMRELGSAEDAPKIKGIQVVAKEQLEDVPIAIVHTKYREGDMGEYVSVTCKLLSGSGELVVFNDGSSGVCAQLRGVVITPRKPMIVEGGLRVSRYTYTDASGKQTPAETWYLNPNPTKRLGANGVARTMGASMRGRSVERVPRGTQEID